MPVYSGPSFFFEPSLFEAHLREHGAGFATAEPYPHAVIDGFLPQALADELAARFPSPGLAGFKRVDHAEQAGRLGHLQRRDFEGVDPLLRHTLNELNGDVFLRFLEQLSGARGLLGDPKFRGAGAHLTLPGGHLDLHADFNRDRFRGLQRSLTMLLYLNPGWQDAWGGALELWPADLSACGRRVLPRHNRCVILQNGDTCFHGHPQPLACPEGVVRQSLAAYYYRSDERERADDPSYTPGEAHGALWVKPPGAGENEP